KLVASGWHTTAVTMQLLVRTLPLSHGIIGTGVDELRWPRPVKPGDTLRVHCEVLDVTSSKLDPSRGTVRMRMTTLNQHDPPVQTMIANLVGFRPPARAARRAACADPTPPRGTVRMRTPTPNQPAQPVQTMIANLVAFRRPERAA